jgi:hypothetical protein
MTTLTAFQQSILSRVQSGILPHSKTNPPQRNTLHHLRSLSLVDFRAGEDDFEWFAMPQETETQEATAVVPVEPETEFVPRKGMLVAFQKAFAAKDTTWYEGVYWGVYAGNPKLHMIRFGGISEPAWAVRSLDGQVAKPAAVQGQIVMPKPETSMDALAKLALKKVFGIEDQPQTIPHNGIEDAAFTEVVPYMFPLVIDVANWERMVNAELAHRVTERIHAMLTEPQAEAQPEPQEDIFDGLAEFTLLPSVTPLRERRAVLLPAVDVTPAMFKQAHRGLVTTAVRVHNRRHGRYWTVGRWSSRLALVLLWDGTLLLLDGPLAYEVRPRKLDTLNTLFNAWAGQGWNKKLANV